VDGCRSGAARDPCVSFEGQALGINDHPRYKGEEVCLIGQGEKQRKACHFILLTESGRFQIPEKEG